MRIMFSPQRRDDTLTVEKDGDALVINGAAFDFSSLPDGATIPPGEVPCEWIAGPVERIGGALHLTLILPHGPDPQPMVAFPAPMDDPPDGVLEIPFSDWREFVSAEHNGEGTVETYILHRWQEPDETVVSFVPDETAAEPEEEGYVHWVPVDEPDLRFVSDETVDNFEPEEGA